MASPFTCANLLSEVAGTETDFYSPVKELCIQLLTLAPQFAGGYVYSGNYSGVAPTFTPTGPAIAIDSVTRRQWQYNGTAWS